MNGFINDYVSVYDVDNCQAFVNISRKREKDVYLADITSIPFENSYFNFLFSVASFHHLATKERRLQALNEVSNKTRRSSPSLCLVARSNTLENRKTLLDYGNEIFILKAIL